MWTRAAAAMFSVTRRWMPSRRLASARARAARRSGHGAWRRAVELHPAPEEEVRVVVAEREVRVGHGRLDAAAPVAGRPGIGPRRARPDLEEAHLVDGAIDPPPAPISIMSITGALIGSPDPLRKRWTRATSVAGAIAVGRRRRGTPSPWCRPCRSEIRPPCRRAPRRTRLRARPGRPGFQQADRKDPRRRRD